jgi:hypothetical protein
MDESQQKLADRLKVANNILVTVGHDPSVDQLAALLGLTLFLNKQGKHAAAVFSGEVPSTLEFLQPEETIEKNTDSLRDFIIALDKAKADKLRYKVEDNVVRIFITPYKTSISQDDFEFSQGDFNVDVVVAIGVRQQEDLDEAVIAHGRILHDATVATINTGPDGDIGTINLHGAGASSLSEIVTQLVESLDKSLVDQQIATALLTGIVAETDRFSNEKTTAATMTISAALMAAGANQQLVASKLQEENVAPEQDGETGDDSAGSSESGSDEPGDDQPAGDHDGTLEIKHDDADESDRDEPDVELPAPDENAPADTPEPSESEPEPDAGLSAGSRLITEPPSLGGTLTANSQQETLDPTTDPLSQPGNDGTQMLTHQELSTPDEPAPTPQEPAEPAQQPEESALPPAPEPDPPLVPLTPMPTDFTPPPLAPVNDAPAADIPAGTVPADTPPAAAPNSHYSTLADLEESITKVENGAPAAAPPPSDPTAPPPDVSELDAARDEVSRALNQATADGNFTPQPIQALNAQPLGDNLHAAAPPASDAPQANPPAPVLPSNTPQVVDPNAPPPVPPPIPFQFGQSPPQQ